MALAVGFLAQMRGHAASVLFRDSGDSRYGRWDHVGFEANGWVWESHPGYEYRCFIVPGIAWDPELNGNVLVATVNGVQYQHSTGSFKWDSCSPSLSPTVDSDALHIDQGLANSMYDEALLVRGYRFLSGPPYSPARQKGAEGQFTCCGLVEYCAEAAGHQGGQGFIPDCYEAISVLGQTVQTITPTLLYCAIKEGWTPSDGKRRLIGLSDPVDFVLTDPLGRRTGHTAATGTLNEIPRMVYTGEGTSEELVLSDPTPGTYRVDLTGLGAEAHVAIGDGSGSGYVYDGFLAVGERTGGSFRIGPGPELAIKRIRKQLTLSWPTTEVGFVLESSPGVSSGSNWQKVSVAPVETNGLFVVPVDGVHDTQVYRLRLAP